MQKECVWYNGETGSYELLDFDPDGLSKEEIIEKATATLSDKYCFDEAGMKKTLESLYLLPVGCLERLNDKG